MCCSSSAHHGQERICSRQVESGRPETRACVPYGREPREFSFDTLERWMRSDSSCLGQEKHWASNEAGARNAVFIASELQPRQTSEASFACSLFRQRLLRHSGMEISHWWHHKGQFQFFWQHFKPGLGSALWDHFVFSPLLPLLNAWKVQQSFSFRRRLNPNILSENCKQRAKYVAFFPPKFYK